jgi:hypothetical protein
MQLTAQILNSMNITATATRVAAPSEGWEDHLADARNATLPLYRLLGAGGTQQYTYVIFQVSGLPKPTSKIVLVSTLRGMTAGHKHNV